MRNRFFFLVALITMVGLGAVCVGAATFAPGDVFVNHFPLFGNQPATVQWYNSVGVLQDTITLPAGLQTAGMRHHPITGQLWVTTFMGNSVAIIDTSGNFVTTYAVPDVGPESIVFDSAGNAWVGGPGAAKIVELSPAGNVLNTYNVAPNVGGSTQGTDWIELSLDERTIYYTGEGSVIKRFDIVNGVQLPDFADLSAYNGDLFASRVLTDGTLLVATLLNPSGSSVYRLNASGHVIQTYPMPADGQAFALALTTDGQDFYAGDTDTLYRFNIASGATVAPFNPLHNILINCGIAVYGDTNHAGPCVTNKTVDCNAAWDFDPPVACNACCQNLVFSIVRTVTYSDAGHSYYTRTWQATDCCSKIVTWSQTVTVVNAAAPVVTLCPTNIVVCVGTNDCGPMPDATGQVLASANGVPLPVAQSIPPGTVLCSGTTVTFTATNSCGQATNCVVPVVLQRCCCESLLQRPWGSTLTNIAVWEQTDSWTRHDFSVVPFSLKMLKIPGGPTINSYDFATSAGEYYDVYLSDADGTPDTNGCCVTVSCYMDQTVSNYSSGGNIGGVELDFADGAILGASSVGSVQLGQGITDPALLASHGQATNALGLHNLTMVPAKTTFLGYSNSSITVYYKAPCVSSIAVITSGDTLTLTWPKTVGPNYWQLQQAPSIFTASWTNLVGATNPPVVISNTTLPQLYFRLILTTNFGTN